MTTETITNIEQAARTFIARRDRTAHPSGKFDKAGRWYPSENETCECCSSVRSPSRSFPYSYMTHCRTMAHVASLYNVSVADLRKEVRKLDPDSAPAKPSREGGDRYFKAVRRVGDRLISIHDGTTEYRIGEEMKQPARQDHGGGFYAYRSFDAARTFGVENAGKDAVVIRVSGAGNYCTYDNKIAFSRLTPVEIVAELSNEPLYRG